MATILQTVSLKEARFYAPIGYYEEEQVLGNEFFVSIDVCFPFLNTETENLKNTLNYEELYQITASVMQPKRKLLESAASEILDQIRLQVADAVTIEVVIRNRTLPLVEIFPAPKLALNISRIKLKLDQRYAG